MRALNTKNISLSVLLILSNTLGYAQNAPFSNLQTATPPSPEATAFVQQDFTPVKMYAGKLSYSIPIYTLTEGGVDFPIVLNYTGGNGIKVEEVASSVGLGWSLQYTGVVTRVIKGIADDCFNGYIGYIHLPGFDSTVLDASNENWDHYRTSYSHGSYDSQPDTYYISTPSFSASFYISKKKEIIFVEKSDLKVDILWAGYKIDGFKVTDLSGNKYIFNVKEENKSVSIANSSEYNLFDVSSWYLSEILDPFGNTIYSFVYQDKSLNETKQLIRSPYNFLPFNQTNFDESQSSYTELYNKRPLLERIETSTKVVNFIKSENARYDLAGDHYMDSILVKDINERPIRAFNFDYSYFSQNGTIQEGEGNYYADGDPTLRLKLNRLELVGADNQTKQAYLFKYNTEKLLPNRLTTFAMDHWGYYNGIASNTSWEAYHREKYYSFTGNITFFEAEYGEFGSANREPDSTYGAACILKEVTTPLGGIFQFEYEGQTSTDSRLPSHIQSSNTSFTFDEQKKYFSTSMIDEPLMKIGVKALVDDDYYTIQYEIRDSLESEFFLRDTLKNNSFHYYMLDTGQTYYIKAKLLGSPHPDPDYHYDQRLYTETETQVLNKPVGGLRIKSTQMYDPITNQTLTRKYYYNESGSEDSNSPSTGTISEVPNYGYQFIEIYDDFYQEDLPDLVMPHGFIRQLYSSYPLIATSGSYVGYNKVTVVENDSIKSEYHYTSFDEFPQFSDGFFNDAFPDGMGIVEGTKFEIFPFVPKDERDYLRGKLKREVIYKNVAGEYKKVKEIENKYEHNIDIKGSRYTPDNGRNSNDYIIGMVFSSWPELDYIATHFKKYRLHTGKYDLSKRIEKDYVYNDTQVDSLINETSYEYSHCPERADSNFHYQITKVINKSPNITDTTYLYYPYDWRELNSDITSVDTTNLRILESQNRIGVPVISKKVNSNNNHIVTIKNWYSSYNDNMVLPHEILIKRGLQSNFDKEVKFQAYGAKGNVLQQQKHSDMLQSNIWDYNNSYVIAQVSNASINEIAYTSFEADGKGSWEYDSSPVNDATAPTGDNIYIFDNDIVRNNLNSNKSYIVSYWKKQGTVVINGTSGISGQTINGWTYYEHRIDNPVEGEITLSGNSAKIDELRLYPVTAMMTTYTYNPSMKISSRCDENSKVTYYKYDPFGRLSSVSDEYKKVLHKTIYYQIKPALE